MEGLTVLFCPIDREIEEHPSTPITGFILNIAGPACTNTSGDGTTQPTYYHHHHQQQQQQQHTTTDTSAHYQHQHHFHRWLSLSTLNDPNDHHSEEDTSSHHNNNNNHNIMFDIVILISIFTTSPHKTQPPIGNKLMKIDLRGILRDDYGWCYWIESQPEEQKEKKGVLMLIRRRNEFSTRSYWNYIHLSFLFVLRVVFQSNPSIIIT